MIHEALLRGLAPGGVMWLQASGRSLWPLLRDGDSLRVERVDAQALERGDVAVVKLPGGVLAAHVVIETSPLTTASTAGIVDVGPVEGLARVTGYRRDGVVHAWPRDLRLVLRHWPKTARALKYLPWLRGVVRRLRDR